jgi:parvulin-like peptidyl-prolyl isomerase
MNDEIQTASVESQTPVNAPVSLPAWKRFLATPKGKLAALAVALIVVVAVVISQTYVRPVTDPFVRLVSRVLPLPALKVGGKTVTINEFLIEYDALQSYFNDLGEPPPAHQLEVAIADTLVNKIAIAHLAKTNGVALDDARVEEYFQDVVAGQESREVFEQNLIDTFGWTPEVFRKRIVESIVLALQMADAVRENDDLQAPRAQLMTDAYARILAGEDFGAVAKEAHAPFEGVQSDLGYVQASVLPEAWADQVNALAAGQITEVIELPEGYVVFKLEEKIAAGEDTQLHLLSITIPKVTLEEVVEEYLDGVQVKRYVGEV